MIPLSEASILNLLQPCGRTSAAEICTAYRMTSGEVRARFAGLRSPRLIAGRQEARIVSSARVFVVINEGQRKVGGT